MSDEKKILHIEVRNKIARLVNDDEFLVCGNSDYEVHFDFDSDWDGQTAKTALFVYGDTTIEEPFFGEACDGVAVEKATKCYIGVFAGDIITTTKAEVKCLPSIRDIAKTPKPPKEDVYNKIMQLLNDVVVGAGTTPYNGTPEMNGEPSSGKRNEYARGDHIHPIDTSRASAKALDDLVALVQELKKQIENFDPEQGGGGQIDLEFDGEYNAVTNKVATVQTVVNKVAEIVANAPEDFDTLKELADWIETHGTDAAKMNSAIKANTNAITAEVARAKEAESQLRAEIVNADYTENDATKKSHILNRPFYREEPKDIHIEFNRTEVKARLEVDCGDEYLHDGWAYRVSELTPTKEQLMGATAVAKYSNYDLVQTKILDESNVFEETADGLWIKVTTGLINESYIFVAYTEQYQPSVALSPLPAVGIYFTYMNHNDDPYTHSLDFTYANIKRLDNEFIDLKRHPDFRGAMGDISSALDAIIAKQTEVIGGDA